MQNRSSKLFYEDDHSQASEYTITSLNDDSIGWNSDRRFASSQENSFTTNSMFEFQTKKVKTNQRNGQDKNHGEDRARLNFADSKINAIDMLEQFKCTVKSRGTFTSPFGAPPKVSVTKVYDTTFADAIDQKSKKDKAKRSARKGKELEPPISSSREPSKSPEKEDSRTDTLINVSSENLDEVNYDEFGDKPPEWALKENAVDKKGNRPGDPEYNPSTLKIPRGALDSYTPLMRQYWEIKSNHFDEILLFKVGDFYRVCYEDAVICHKELNLNWLGNKMIVGVHEKNFDHDVEVLVNLGYKVSVAEQTETAKLKKKRVKSQREMGEKGSGEKIIQRQIAQVMSKGTFIDYNNPNYEPRYLLALRTRRTEVAIVLLEIGYSVITVGYFNDNESFLKLKTLITQIRPTEVVYDKKNANEYIINYLRYSHNAPVLSPIVVAKFWNSISVHEELEKYYGDRHDKWPEVLQGVLQMDTSRKDLIMMDFAIMINYLQQTLIVDQVLQTARYEAYDPESLKKTKMILDAQALQHLEILEVSYSTKNSYEGSLLSYIDNTTTKYGKRLLKKWICAPLVDVEAINNRLDAIEELDEKSEVREDLRSGLKRLHDFQRVCGKIYSLSIRRPENLILFEDVSLQRLREFKNILENFQTARDLIADVQDLQWKSTLLKDLLILHDHRAVLNNESTLMPDITPLLEELSSFIVWGGSNKDVPAPKPGVDKEYDRIVNEIEWINRQFAQHLEEVRNQFDGNKLICYTHTKCRYEIEIPVELVQGSKKPADFEISSKRKGFERFITPRVSELVPKLDEAEDKLKEVLKLFVCFVFRYFYNYNKVWDAFINGLAQIDCLCSLSVTSFSTDERMCRPQISEQAERPYLEVKSMKHPCVSVYKPNFVPNDIVLGDPDNTKNDKNIIMITGPNMGGKSTILRQACIAAILAQIGCYIPAESCRMTVVDRVFTRIGASDRLIEGKSTFSIEMEEVLSVLRDGTRNSLAIMDELGRGTTTFDGIAIAYAVLKHLSEKLKCRTLFATHYHILLDEFRFNRNITFYYMDYHIDNKHEKVEFRYRLTEGECSKSFGLNIAKVAGIESQVVERARAKAEEFDREFNLRDNIKVSKLFSKVIGVLINKELNRDDSENMLLQMLENTIK